MSKSDMSDRAGKPRVQDLLGLFMCVLGGLCSVSILLSFLGRQPKESWLTTPVVGLRESIGPWPSLIFSVALAVLGTTLFLATRGLSLGRHLAGIGGLTLGVTLLVGAFSASAGGAVGGALPATIPGMPGGVLALAVGVTLLLLSVWLTWLGAEPSPRLSLAGTGGGGGVGVLEVPDPEGVSAAESAALLEAPARPKAAPGPSAAPAAGGATEPFGAHPRLASPGDVRVRGGVPPGTRPLDAAPDAAKEAPDAPAAPPDAGASPSRWSSMPSGKSSGASGPMAASATAPPARPAGSGKPAAGSRAAPGSGNARQAPPSEGASGSGTVEPPKPFWEEGAAAASAGESAGESEREGAPLPAKDWEQSDLFDAVETAEAEALPVAEAPPEALDEVDEDEVDEEEEELEDELDEEVSDELYDEEDGEEDGEEEEDEELEDEDEDEDGEVRGEEEEEDEDEYEDEEDEELEDEEEEDRLDEEPGPAEATPGRKVAAERVAAPAAPHSGDLVYEAGRLILEENRVAVSMLERRFGIEFQRACEVLDELQSRGLIGPYIGGRTRDILLSPEDWAAQAPGGKR